MRFSRQTRARVFGLAVAALAVGCGDDKAGGANKDTVSADGGSKPAEGTMIDAEKGGKVSYESVAVDIPAGALAKDTEITVAAVDGSKLPDPKLLVGDVYDLGPDGTKFLKPVTLTFDLGGAEFTDDEVPTMAYLEKDAWQWLEDSAVKNGKVVATTTHFTVFGVVRRTASVAPMEDAGPGADAGGGSGGTTMSCDRGSSADQTMHSCGEDAFSVMLGKDLLDRMKEGCTQSGGKVVASCDLTGSVGGCRLIVAKEGEPLTRTSTIWHYSGDAASEMKTCESLNEDNEPGDPEWMFVAPE